MHYLLSVFTPNTALVMAVSILMILTVACSPSSTPPAGEPKPGATTTSVPAPGVPTASFLPADSYTVVERDRSPVTATETWRNGNIYVLRDDITVEENATLAIEPGVIVKLIGGDRTQIFVKGTIRAEGTAEHPIFFTSLHDDAIGGDTDGDSGANTPLPGDWDVIIFEDSSSDERSVMRNVEFRYAGAGWWGGPIGLNNASPTLENIRMVDNRRNAFVVAHTTWHTNHWNNTGIPYYLPDDITIDERSTLTIGPGVIIKLSGGDRTQIFVKGAIKAEGTEDAPIMFTSLYDDTIGGDADNDAGETAPLPGDWDAIIFEDSSSDERSAMRNTEFRYAGAGWWGGPIGLNNASPTLENVRMRDNRRNAFVVAHTTWRTNRWHNLGIPYYLPDDITIEQRSTLTIAPGVVVKLSGGDRTQIFVDGVLKAEGTPERRIVFTSLQDDTVGGDTNNDGDASAPLAGDWDAVIFRGQTASQSVLRHVDIKYARDKAVRLEKGASPILDDVNVMHPE